ncbi:hypothetical protein H0H87_011338 [Tephrocybe sp. NHM501043]|nr:hypothetical protein H0H87_011338 [Tephrocybe sp. NHM501043]
MTTTSITTDTALLVIDVQQAFNSPQYREPNGDPSTPDVFTNVAQVLSAFRSVSLPVIHVHHHDNSPNSPFSPINSPHGVKPVPEAVNIPGEAVFIKNGSSGFIGTGLEAHLKETNIKKLVVVGLTAIHCVSSTVRMAANLGWEVYVSRDATATFGRDAAPGGLLQRFDAKTMHEVALSELHNEFATIVTTAEIVRAVEGFRG